MSEISADELGRVLEWVRDKAESHKASTLHAEKWRRELAEWKRYHPFCESYEADAQFHGKCADILSRFGDWLEQALKGTDQ